MFTVVISAEWEERGNASQLIVQTLLHYLSPFNFDVILLQLKNSKKKPSARSNATGRLNKIKCSFIFYLTESRSLVTLTTMILVIEFRKVKRKLFKLLGS